MKASNGRYNTQSAASLEKKLDDLDEQFERTLQNSEPSTSEKRGLDQRSTRRSTMI
ncbi:MAG: hypothetical protein R3C05_13465 [Pirellulaceae bacterium]